jgi:hypothetical protein
VVPLADPPVGTRGRPLRDLFFSGIVGNNQFPALTAVLEKGRCEAEWPFLGRCVAKALGGRNGNAALESFSRRAVKLWKP